MSNDLDEAEKLLAAIHREMERALNGGNHERIAVVAAVGVKHLVEHLRRSLPPPPPAPPPSPSDDPCYNTPVAPVDVGGLRKDSHAEHQREALREVDDVPGDDRAGGPLVGPVHRGERETGAVGTGRGERGAWQDRAELPPGARFVVGEQVEAWHRVTGRVAWCGTGPDACVGIVDEDGEEWDFSAERVRKADV